MRHSMLLCVLLLGAGVAFTTAEDYNFNSYKYCKRNDEFDKSLSSGERATVIFREKTQADPFQLVPDECSMEFKAPLLINNRLQVKFDSINRYINDSQAKITFYDSDEIKLSKKLKEYSKAKPIKRLDTIVTTGRYLTIVVSRDVKKSKNFKVEMTITPIAASAGTSAVWSLPLMSLSALVVALSGAINI